MTIRELRARYPKNQFGSVAAERQGTVEEFHERLRAGRFGTDEFGDWAWAQLGAREELGGELGVRRCVDRDGRDALAVRVGADRRGNDHRCERARLRFTALRRILRERFGRRRYGILTLALPMCVEVFARFGRRADRVRATGRVPRPIRWFGRVVQPSAPPRARPCWAEYRLRAARRCPARSAPACPGAWPRLLADPTPEAGS